MRRTVTSIAGCEGIAKTVTAAHYSIWRHLHDSMQAAKKQESRLEFVTLDKESNMGTLWRKGKFFNMRSKQQVSEKAQEVEKK